LGRRRPAGSLTRDEDLAAIVAEREWPNLAASNEAQAPGKRMPEAKEELVRRRGSDFKCVPLLGDREPPLDYRDSP
jgi:hypothetical protein